MVDYGVADFFGSTFLTASRVKAESVLMMTACTGVALFNLFERLDDGRSALTSSRMTERGYSTLIGAVSS